jgi:signal peptidase I
MIDQNPSPKKSGLYAIPGGLYALSGTVLKEIIRAATGKGASIRFKALGFSMSPFIKDGDIVTISPPADRQIRKGIVAAFVHPQTDRLVVHRIIRATPRGIWMRGDNTFESDGIIPLKNVLGFVTQVRRGQKRIFYGRGAGGAVIAALSRRNFLRPSIIFVWSVMHPLRFLRKSIQKPS